MVASVRIALGVLLCVAATSGAPARKGKAAQPEAAPTVEELARRIRPSVVVVSHFGRDGKEDGVGAGFIISSNGLIATSLHVIGEARQVKVKLADGAEHDVTGIHAWDRNLDLAIVRIEGRNLPALPLGDSDQLVQGTPVVAMGNPLGMQHSIVQGVVSARRDFEGVEMIQIAIPIEAGNSGGPLVDMQGRAHGLLTLKSALTANLGFAMPVNELKKLIAKPNPVPMSRWLTFVGLNSKEWETLMGAQWRQRAGRIQVEGTGKGFGGRSLCLSRRITPERPYEVAVSVRLDDEAGAAGLAFAAEHQDAHYGFYPTAGQLRLTRFEGPTVFSWTILTTTNSPHYRPGEWNHLRVRVENEKLLCYVNDHLAIESTDTVLKKGRAGLATFRNTRAEFKGFQVGPKITGIAGAPEVKARLQREGPQLSVNDLIADFGDAAYPAIAEYASNLERRAAELRRLSANARQKEIQQELAKLMQRPEQEIDLLHAALLVSKLDNPELDLAPYREQVESMAGELKATLSKTASNDERLQRLIRFLFAEGGFHGSRSDFYHRANSYMDRVLDDREGLPITLAVLFLELARRTGVGDVSAAPLPGHFMVAYNPPRGERKFIDVFDGGKILTATEAGRVASEASGAAVEATEWETPTKRDIIIRILRNLANVAERSGSAKESLRYLDTVVALAPDAPLERLGRAMARLGNGDVEGAREDLRVVIEAEPAGVDLRRIEELYRRLRTPVD